MKMTERSGKISKKKRTLQERSVGKATAIMFLSRKQFSQQAESVFRKQLKTRPNKNTGF